MRQALSVILILCWLSYLSAPLCAQPIPPGPLNSYSLLSEKDNLPLSYLPEPAIASSGPIQTEAKPSNLLITENNYLYFKFLQAQIAKSDNTKVDHKLFSMLYNKPQIDEKKKIREEWKRVFSGVDVWYPYYKAKDTEKWVKKKFSLKTRNFKGEPELTNDGITYTFKRRF